MKRICLLLLVVCTMNAVFGLNVPRKPYDKYILIMKPFDLLHPEAIDEEDFTSVMDNFSDDPKPNLHVGLAVIFSYFAYDLDILCKSLERVLFYAQQTNTPILIKLDGEQWWQNRPDLWNWWDPEMPGFDPKNAENVEWRWWGPEYALKIAWRNWGHQIRVLPPPNLMSLWYRRECHKAMEKLLAVIKGWETALPDNQKHLFVGINVGWESSIGVNGFYFPNGNDLIDKPESEDPQGKSTRSDVLSRGAVQIGYAAVKAAGIRDSGDIAEEDLVEVVRRHLYDLSKFTYESGFPREKIFTHGWGNEKGELLYDASVNEYSCPGWSDYWYADNPSNDKGIVRNLKKSDAPYWAAVEWMLLKPFEKDLWKDAIQKTISFEGCKFVCIYNWAMIQRGPVIIEAIHELDGSLIN